MSSRAGGGQRSARADRARDQEAGGYSVMVGIWEPTTEREDRAAESADADAGPVARSLTYWDADARELWLDGELVKRYRQDAPSQWRILAAFQEEGWPPSIDDPLPGSSDRDPKERLHHTVRNMNRGQGDKGIHFGVGGLGERVFWRPAGSG